MMYDGCSAPGLLLVDCFLGHKSRHNVSQLGTHESADKFSFSKPLKSSYRIKASDPGMEKPTFFISLGF